MASPYSCPRCQELLGPGKERCGRCGASLVVDAVISAPATSPAAAAPAARAVAALGRPAPDYDQALERLQHQGATLARAVPPDLMRSLAAATASSGARLLPRYRRATPFKGLVWLLLLIPLAFFAGVVYAPLGLGYIEGWDTEFWLFSPTPEASEASDSPPDAGT